MKPLDEVYFEDWKKWTEGEITKEEFEARFQAYKIQYNEAEFNSVFGEQEIMFNSAESWLGFEQLEKIAEAGWRDVIGSINGTNEETIGRFMYAWLCLEHSMNLVLFEIHQINSPSGQYMFEHIPFWKRVNSLHKKGKLYSPYIKLLKALSKIRNGLVHNLAFNTDDIYIGKELSFYLSKKTTGKTREDVLIYLLHDIRFYFMLETKALIKKRDDIMKNNPSLQALLNRTFE